MIVHHAVSHAKLCTEDQTQSVKRCISKECMHWRTLEGKAALDKFTTEQIEMLKQYGFCGKSECPEISSLCIAASEALGMAVHDTAGKFQPMP